MWKFRPIGDYYELLVDGATLYLCKKKDSIMQAVLEDLCDRHNKEIALYENTNPPIESYEQAYQNGYEDGYRRALVDIGACEDNIT